MGSGEAQAQDENEPESPSTLKVWRRGMFQLGAHLRSQAAEFPDTWIKREIIGSGIKVACRYQRHDIVFDWVMVPAEQEPEEFVLERNGIGLCFGLMPGKWTPEHHYHEVIE